MLTKSAAEVACFAAQLSVTMFYCLSCSFSYVKIHGCALGEPPPGNLMWSFPEPPGDPGTPFGGFQEPLLGSCRLHEL